MTASETTKSTTETNGTASGATGRPARRPRTRPATPATTSGPMGDPMADAMVEPFHGGPSEVAVDSAVVAEIEDDALPDDRFSNRELSWLDFNARVLALAEDPRQKLLERAKFLAIFASNLDEFYMVRVAGLKRRRDMGLSVTSADGLTASEQLALISARTRELVERQGRCFVDEVLPALADAGIRIVHWSEVNEADRARLGEYFTARIFPVLTPLAVDPAHPFPYISGLSLSLAIIVRNPETGTERFARVKVPPNVDRFIQVRRGVYDFLPLEELIATHLGQLFPGMDVTEHQAFRVTRNADLEVEEDRDEDLLQALERELARRRFGPPVRLEVTNTTSERVLAWLLAELDVDPADAVEVPGLLDLSSLWQLYGIDKPGLKDAPFVPATNPAFAEGETPKSVFSTLRDGDVLLHHPYESFATTVQRFIEQAAADPRVLAIKQTLYRTSGDSPIVDALISAAEAGKEVVALVELKARFDEQANISWAKALERAGVHVVYGLVGLKTHCKTALVIRQEGKTLQRYCHLATGNYNPKTARIYEDLGLLTADPDIGADLTDLFNVLTGYSRQTEYRNLLVAPQSIRSGIVTRIEREIEHQRAGRGGLVRLKMNSIVDERVIDALYRASRAGVAVDVTVRGICALRAGVPGLSENITVRSIVGRFLEHSRIFYFRNGGQPVEGGGSTEEYWIGSADMMHRNLDRRVEVLVQVKDKGATDRMARLFELLTAPDTRCWTLGPDGWTPSPVDGPGVDIQEELLRGRVARGE
ncbi:RNA degradosome polyphosphate kinase [Nakamurella multipartita]|uniref:Polyphosphate kinase n=1 Tax=Nakamurella multipartita (strain ATCC 700099 / DSM 44233 / CIP 104796 / JCM 9543 / NBRC 105858 / Y-104) TaxID=479431 RepID=C8XEZ5_NAKMY|nr:RNA degradosome polyphosphate kinase [Nakamurella multipartita]ACV77881.1 Polyphosphate kinase [Nakamurella multipartita DSM 44233]HOZ57422.1 RNA degradosome polyphosphate kinase [Nakamurella multipartita]